MQENTNFIVVVAYSMFLFLMKPKFLTQIVIFLSLNCSLSIKNHLLQGWSRGSKVRGQGHKKKNEAKDSPSDDRPSRGQGQECLRPRSKTQAQVFPKKFFFRRSPKKRSSKYFFLVLELHSRGVYVQANADDLVVLVTGADMLCIRGMAQKATHIAANWASEQELQFSSKKTEGLLFTHNRNPDLDSLSMSGSKLEV